MTTSAEKDVPGRPRRGMTLVELLIVVGLLSVFMALVVAGVRNSQTPQVRRVAEQLAAALASAQARSLGVPEGAGTIVTIVSNSAAVYDAVMQPLIEATVTGVPPTPPSATTASVSVTPTNADDATRAYKILFTGTGGPGVSSTAWMAFSSGNVSFRTGTAGTGQTTANTVWPKPLASGTLNALLGQYPGKGSAAVGLGDAITVDTRYSGTGDGTQFSGRAWIAVVFDRVGRVGEVLTCSQDPDIPPSSAIDQPVVPASTIYLLVARKEEVDANTSLASDESLWVAIAPQTGRVILADNVPQSDTSQIRAARQNARQGIAAKR